MDCFIKEVLLQVEKLHEIESFLSDSHQLQFVERK